MNIFDSLVLNMILLIFPMLLWLIYLVHNKNVGARESGLLFDFCSVTSLYLLTKFGIPIIDNKFLILINIPLIIAYYKNKKSSIILLSIIIILYNFQNFSYFSLYLILEYLLYYLIYCYFKSDLLKIIIISVLKVLIFTTLYTLTVGFIDTQLIYVNISFITILILIIIMYKRFDDIINYHMSLKELEQEKQFRASLFRITHEIKNPIAVCKGYLDMFDTHNEEHSKKYIPILKAEIERTLILLKDFLYMTKITIDKEIVDVIMILEDVIDNFTPILKENSIECEISIPEEGVYIYGDYNRLLQVFINMLKNSIEAVDYSKKSKIIISSSITNDNVYIYIYDNGTGINDEVFKKIGNPFFTTKPNGTGLGVSLSREIIKAHGGIIKYNSIEGLETKVEIKLPIIKKHN